MAKPANTKLTPEVARDLCQRADAKAYIAGSIASLGSQYVIGLDAINCGSLAEFVGKWAVEKAAPWKSPKAGLSPSA